MGTGHRSTEEPMGARPAGRGAVQPHGVGPATTLHCPPHHWTVTRVLWGRPHAVKAFPEGPGEPGDTGVNAGATGRP